MRRISAFALILAASFFLRAETFPNPRLIPAASDPTGVYVTDLNNDGRPDIVYSSSNIGQPSGTPRSLYVLLAQADGSYQSLPPITLTANTRPDCRPVDVNADGKIDLVCSEFTTQTGGTTTYYYYARTLLGNGDGTFQPAIISSFGPGQAFVVEGAADFNHDGNIDLAVTYTDAYGSNYNEILRGDGAGHFTTVSAPSVGQYFSIQDVNNDGWPDFMDPTGPSAFLNKGDGTLTFNNPLNSTIYFVGCVYGDMDNDGRLDAVCLSWNTTPAINVIRGNGDGTFDVAHPVLTVPVLSTDLGSPLKLLDLNHDGLLDIVTPSSNGLTVFLGKGNLQFNDATRYNLPGIGNQFYLQHAYDIADVNGDGNYDIVASAPDGIYITYGRADGTFDATQNFATATAHTATASADFNGDGLVDVITFSAPDLYLWTNKGDGSTGVPQKIDIGSLSLTASSSLLPFLTGDFNGDGKKDLIVFGAPPSGTNQTYLLQGKGDGSFTTSTLTGGTFTSNTVVSDLNADSRDDLVRTDLNYLYSKLSQPDGSFAAEVTSALTPQYITSTTPPFVIADFDHDGKMDAAVAFQDIFIHRGNGDGTFGPASAPLSIPYNQSYPNKIVADMEVGDFDGDDNPDLAVLFYTGGSSSDLAVYYGDGTGNFSNPVHLQFSSLPYSKLTIADLDGDGRSDLILSFDMTYAQNYSLSVVHALDNRSFGPLKNYMIGRNNPFLLLPIDLNRDGFSDLLVGTSSTARTVLLNDPGPVVGRTLTVQPEPSAIGQSFNLNARLTPPTGSTTMPTGTISFSIDRVPAGTAAMTNGAAALTLNSTLSLGSHKVSAYWPGDSNYPSIIFSTTHTVTLIPVTISFSGVPTAVTVGDNIPLSFSFSDTVASPSFPPTGTYSVLEGSAQIGSGTITANNSSFSLSDTSLTVGTHTFTVQYSGDSTHSTAATTISVTVNPAATATSLRSSAAPVPYGQPITFTITITPEVSAGAGELVSSGSSTVTLTGLPGGAVTLPVVFPAGSAGNTPAVITYSPAANLAPGTYPLTASFSGNTNLLGSSAALSQVVSPPPSITGLTLLPTPSYANHMLTLTAKVSGVITTPTGSVQLMDGATMLATVTLVNGNATFSTQTLAVGSHSFTANYSGDANNAPSTATLAASVLPYDFALSATPASASFSRGSNATVTITANSIGGFAENISFSVTGQPASLTATIAPATIPLTAGATNTAVLTVTGTSTAALQQHGFPIRVLSASLIAALLPFSFIRRRRSRVSLLTIIFALSLITAIAGCSGGTSGPESYTLEITATSDQSAITHKLSIPVTITK